jgi:hypothetical protein
VTSLANVTWPEIRHRPLVHRHGPVVLSGLLIDLAELGQGRVPGLETVQSIGRRTLPPGRLDHGQERHLAVHLGTVHPDGGAAGREGRQHQGRDHEYASLRRHPPAIEHVKPPASRMKR